MIGSIDLLIALIGGASTMGAAMLPSYISNRRKTEEVAAKIGEPNGHGTITNMIADVLSVVTSNTSRVTKLEANDRRKQEMLCELQRDVTHIKELLEKLVKDTDEYRSTD